MTTHSITPKTGLDALEDLYAPFTANLTLSIGKFSFRAHLEYLSRWPFFADIDLNVDVVSLDLPVPHRFMDCLTYMYTGEILPIQEGIFIPSSFLDTLRNAYSLKLTGIVDECHKR